MTEAEKRAVSRMKDDLKDTTAVDIVDREDGRTRASFLRKLALTQDRQKRLKVIKAYARLNTHLAEKVLVDALQDPCEEIRDFLIKELGGRKHFDISLALPKLMTPPWYAKSAVLKIIGMKKSTNAVRSIECVLNDANVDVRKCAADALGEIGGNDAVLLLVRLKKDQSLYVRQAAEEALRKASELRFV